MDIQTVGVLGAGIMGTGVAQNLAQTGHKVILLDLDEKILECAREEIAKNVRFQGFFKKEAQPVAPEATLKQILFATDYALLKDADFIIENVPEKWDIKNKVYREIDRICREEVIFAANTSAIPITRIASATARAPRVIGTHFMNPVSLKRVVEVIRGYHTSDETLGITQKLLTAMGKEAIVVNDSPGFVSNRVLMLTINEAIYLVHERVATAQEVDRIFKMCFGHKMGPLETADLIGLDTILYSVEILYESFNDSKYRPCPLLKKMVDAGQYGCKNGAGFYKYR